MVFDIIIGTVVGVALASLALFLVDLIYRLSTIINYRGVTKEITGDDMRRIFDTLTNKLLHNKKNNIKLADSETITFEMNYDFEFVTIFIRKYGIEVSRYTKRRGQTFRTLLYAPYVDARRVYNYIKKEIPKIINQLDDSLNNLNPDDVIKLIENEV